MDKITLKEYAERLGKKHDTCRQQANRGAFKTAERIGRDWFIDPNEPYPDRRVKTGDYIGFRDKYKK